MGMTYQSTVVPVDVDTAWSVLRNFHDLTWAPNVITKLEPVGDKRSHEVGAKRVLNDLFQETLIEFDDDARRLRYSIDDAPGTPASAENVQNYIGTLQLAPVTEGGGTFVEWYSEWDGNDEECQTFCTPIYRALLGDLNKHFGAG